MTDEHFLLVPRIQQSISRCLENVLHNEAPNRFKSEDYFDIKAHQSPILEEFLAYVEEDVKWECFSRILGGRQGVRNEFMFGGGFQLGLKIRHALVSQLQYWMRLISMHQPLRSLECALADTVMPPPRTELTQVDARTSAGTSTTTITNEGMYPKCNGSSENAVMASRNMALSRSILDSTSKLSSMPKTTKRKYLSGQTETSHVTHVKIPQFLLEGNGHSLPIQEANDESYNDRVKGASRYDSRKGQAARNHTQRVSPSTTIVTEQQDQHDDCDEKYNCTYSDSEDEEETSDIGNLPLLAVGFESCSEGLVQNSSARVREPKPRQSHTSEGEKDDNGVRRFAPHPDLKDVRMNTKHVLGPLSSIGGLDENGDILVTDDDVLYGRGSSISFHKGNKRFRSIIAMYRPFYLQATKGNKPRVARIIVQEIRDTYPSMRFLKKDGKTMKWHVVGDKQANAKASQALREKTTQIRTQLLEDSISQVMGAYEQPIPYNGPAYKRCRSSYC